MMNEADDDIEEMIFDRRDLIPRVNKPSDTSGSILLGLNQFNIGIYDSSNKLSKEKSILLAATCISFGMFIGLLGPTIPFLAESMSKEPSFIVWLITIKSIGFLLGIGVSSYLYTWFNVCCLLPLSCLTISSGVCSLPFVTDLTTFYFISFILGIGFGLGYNGIDALYNCLWSPSSSIRWLHLLIAFGAILSTLLLFPSTITSDNNTFSLANITQSPRLPRAISNDTTFSFNTSTIVTKSPFITDQLTSKSIRSNSYCCYHQNNETTTFTCQETNQSDDCQHVLLFCQSSELNICYINNTDIQYRMVHICTNETKPNCAIEVINMNNSTTIISVGSTTSTTTTSSSTSSSTTSTTTQVSKTIIQTAVPNTPFTTSTHSSKPSTAISNTGDLSKNFFYKKMGAIFHSITYIHIPYLILALSFLILGIFYSILAIRGEGITISSIKNLQPLSLILIKPPRLVHNSNPQIFLLSDRSSFKFVFLIILFYFILSSIESSCNYLAYSFGLKFQFSKTESLLLQFCYLFGRFLDISMNYAWVLLDKQTDLISMIHSIILRLLLLLIICLFNLFQPIYHFLFFSIGFCLTSLSSLILSWLERYFCLNEFFLRMIFFTMIISESIFPVLLFSKMEYFISYYLFIALCLLIILFRMVQIWQGNRSYRLLSTAIDMESEDDLENERLDNSKLH